MIVIIDDEKWTISGILDWLEDKNYSCKHFYFPVKAWNYIEKNYQDIKVIISDIMMDYGDENIENEQHGGVQFLEKIKSCEKYKNIPIIIYTVKDKNRLDDIEKYDQLSYLNKNENIEKLYELIEKVSKKNKGSQ